MPWRRVLINHSGRTGRLGWREMRQMVRGMLVDVAWGSERVQYWYLRTKVPSYLLRINGILYILDRRSANCAPYKSALSHVLICWYVPPRTTCYHANKFGSKNIPRIFEIDLCWKTLHAAGKKENAHVKKLWTSGQEIATSKVSQDAKGMSFVTLSRFVCTNEWTNEGTYDMYKRGMYVRTIIISTYACIYISSYVVYRTKVRRLATYRAKQASNQGMNTFVCNNK